MWHDDFNSLSMPGTCAGREMIEKAAKYAEQMCETHSLMAKWQLPMNTTYAYIPTLCNGKPCNKETLNKKVGKKEGNHYRLGIELRKWKLSGKEIVRDEYMLNTFTIWEGIHVLNSTCMVDGNGKLLEIAGKKNGVNCFGLGWIEAEQDFIDQLIAEFEESLKEKDTSIKWETIETE